MSFAFLTRSLCPTEPDPPPPAPPHTHTHTHTLYNLLISLNSIEYAWIHNCPYELSSFSEHCSWLSVHKCSYGAALCRPDSPMHSTLRCIGSNLAQAAQCGRNREEEGRQEYQRSARPLSAHRLARRAMQWAANIPMRVSACAGPARVFLPLDGIDGRFRVAPPPHAGYSAQSGPTLIRQVAGPACATRRLKPRYSSQLRDPKGRPADLGSPHWAIALYASRCREACRRPCGPLRISAGSDRVGGEKFSLREREGSRAPLCLNAIELRNNPPNAARWQTHSLNSPAGNSTKIEACLGR